MTIPLRALIVEDSEDDLLLLLHELAQGGYQVTYERVETAQAMDAALRQASWDLILADHQMPRFNALAALALVHTHGLDLPFIIVSGSIGEDIAVQAMRAGAHDYLLKGQLARLVPAIERELREAHIRQARQQTEAALRESEARYRQMFEQNQAVQLIIDPRTGRIVDANPAAGRFYGYPLAELTQLPLTAISTRPVAQLHAELEHAATRPREFYQVQHRLASGDVRDVEVHASGIQVHGLTLLYAIIHDITERKRLEEQLKHQAFHDPLTNLANRALFRDRLDHALARARRSTTLLAVLYVDLDSFKTINDSLGHSYGDQVLVQVAARLQDGVREGDTVARVGGDEFAILLEDIGTVTDPVWLAERLQARLHAPLQLGAHDVLLTASIGITLSSLSTGDAESLVRDADLAMYRAKTSGKARYAVFEQTMNARARARFELHTDLRHALDQGDLQVYYQPVVDLRSRQVVGQEALVRWPHPQRGMIAPTEFIPVAEEMGLILPLDHLVLRQACLQARQWQHAASAARQGWISVNLSAHQFQHPQLVTEIADLLGSTGFTAANLILEITESVMMQEAQTTIRTMQHLKALGVRLALDDFGTGYSSLSYLKRFPLDMLKIDRAFVQQLGQCREDEAIIHAMITLAKTFHMTVIGEGIETESQATQLQDLGCDLGQGYYFGRPRPAREVDTHLAPARTHPAMEQVHPSGSASHPLPKEMHP